MLNVLHIFSSANLTGGAAFSMCLLAEELNRRDDVRVCAVVPKTGTTVAERLRAAGIPTYVEHISWITHVPYGTGPVAWAKDVGTRAIRAWFTRSTDARIRRIIADEHIDLVHICDGVIAMGLRPALALDKPVVWHLREYVEQDHGHLYDNKRRAFADFAQARAAITVSESLRAHYARMLPDLDIVAVYNGIVNESHFAHFDGLVRKDDSLAWPERRARLLFLGGISESKGTFEVARAMAQLKESVGATFELEVFGRATDENRQAFDRLVEELGIGDVVFYRGWASIDLKTIATYDIELTCSRAEAFGRITAEAMCARTAVVGANTAATAELLSDGRGFLYEQGNPASLAAVAEEALRDASRREQSVERAYQFAREHFTVEQYAHQVHEVYLRALA